jgi:hypothetical protein
VAPHAWSPPNFPHTDKEVKAKYALGTGGKHDISTEHLQLRCTELFRKALICIVPVFFNSLPGTFLLALPEFVRIVLANPTLDVFPHAHSHLAASIGFPL